MRRLASCAVLVGLFLAGRPGAMFAQVPAVLPAAAPEVPALVAAAPAPVVAEPAPVVAAPQVTALANICCDNHCGDGDANHHGGAFAGVGLYLIQPYFDANPAYTVFVQSTGPQDRVDISQHFEVAPLVWLGYMGDNGVGVRGRYWYFREDTNQSLSFPVPSGPTFFVNSASATGPELLAPNPSGFAVTSKLQAQLADIEAVKKTQACGLDLLFSGGVRWTDIDQNYRAYASFRSGPAMGPMIAGSSFDGVGPVVALEARCPVWEGALSVYGNVRSSLVFGSTQESAAGVQTQSGSPAVLGAGHHDQVVAIEECELGVEIQQPIGGFPLFAQIGLVGQEWFGAGNASHSTYAAAPTGFTGFGADTAANLGFFGVVFRIGVTY